MRAAALGIVLTLVGMQPTLVATTNAPGAPAEPMAIALPGGEGGIGFDDLSFSSTGAS